MIESFSQTPVSLTFDSGTIILRGFRQEHAELIDSFCQWDNRIEAWRAMAQEYGPIIRHLISLQIPYEDHVKNFQSVNLQLQDPLYPREDQRNAVESWWANLGRGVVVMPTGAGKSFVARMAIAKVRRSTLIVVPTIDLMIQWVQQLEKSFGTTVGMLGGGEKRIGEKITVSTYDSAVMQMEFIGNRFGFIIFDECHHLPGPITRTASSMCVAPYRLGLTATPENNDQGECENLLWKLIGPEVWRIEVDELKTGVLAPYEIRQIKIPLDPDEQQSYNTARKIYTDFVKQNGITFSDPNGWEIFLGLCARTPYGHKVYKAYLEQKKIAQKGRAKLRQIWSILTQYPTAQTIIFTAENEMAYSIGKAFLLPVLTHQTNAIERKHFLERFRSGEYPVLVTSKVLNEGVDVPQASIGIIVSGSGSIREHVQRLGRILRAKDNKKAILFELISEGTSEQSVSDRRRRHRAYSKSSFKKTFMLKEELEDGI